MDNALQFGQYLRELRAKAHLTLRQLAEKIDVNYSYLSKIENGVLPPPSEKVIYKLAEVLDVNPDELLKLAGKIPSDIVRMLQDEKTLQMLRTKQSRKEVRVDSKETSMISKLKELIPNMSNLVRVTIAITLMLVVGASIWYASPTQALNMNYTNPASGTLGNTYAFTFTMSIQSPERIQIHNLDMSIFNTSSPAYTASLLDLPISTTTRSYTSAQTGGGDASLTATADVALGYSAGAKMAYWSGGTLTLGTGGGYTSATITNVTYNVNWVAPASWPSGTYQIEVRLNGNSTVFNKTSNTFSLTAASGPGPAPAPTTTPTPTETPTTTPTPTNTTPNVVPVTTNAQGVVTQPVAVPSSDNKVTLSVNTGTTAKTADNQAVSQITVTPMVTPPAPPPQASNIVAITYNFGPEGATFNPPANLSFKYDPATLGGVPESSLRVAFYDSKAGQWVILSGTIDTVNHVIVAQVPHFTAFTVISTTQTPPAFSIKDMEVSPAEVKPGDKVNIKATIANTGEQTGAYNYTINVNGALLTAGSLNVTGNGTATLTATASKGAAGVYTVDLNGLTRKFTVTAAPAPTPTVTPTPTATPKPTTTATPTPTATATPTPPPTPEPQPSSVNWLAIGSIIALVVVVALVILVLVRRRQNTY